MTAADTTGGLWTRLRRPLAIATSVIAILWGLVLIIAAATLGGCSAFGGTCPRDPPPLLEDDVFGMSASGAFLAVFTPLLLLRRRSWRHAAQAAAAGAAAAIIIGLTVRSGAHG